MDSVEPTLIVKANKKCNNVNIVNGNCKCNVENFDQLKTSNNILRKYIRLLLWIILAIIIFFIIRSFII